MNPFLDKNVSQFVIRYRDDIDRSLKFNKSKPISVSSDLQLQRNKKKKNKQQLYKRNSVQKISRKKPGSLHTNCDDKKDQKQISRIPIQYLQQRDTGNPSDKVRGRIVYRGYAPKNTYFYFKTIKQLRFESNFSKQDKDYRGEDVIFNSKFQSGNLHSAVRINNRQYWLYMRQDTNTHGLRQWFFFEMRVRRDCKIKLRIYKFSKKFSLYKCGMKPFVKKSKMDWKQDGLNIIYQYDPEQKCFFLQFQYEFEAHEDTYFATLPPYTYSNLNDYIQTLYKQQKINIKKIGNSLSGLDIVSINIVEKDNYKETPIIQKLVQKIDVSIGQSYTNPKEAIIVLCRTHPGQTVSNFALESFISRILQLNVLTKKYSFYIIPMINPDGVFVGNHRTGILGQDLNRKFIAMDLQFFPEVQIVQNFVLSIQKKHKIAFLFDLHGHSAKKNIFAYGQQASIGSNKYLMSRIIPKILQNCISSFKYDYCVFKAAKQKQNTARVYFSNKNGINAITFEQSYGLLDVGLINICHWKSFGTALADALLQYQKFPSSNLIPQISSYMLDQMNLQRQMKLNKERKRKQQLQLQALKKTTKFITMKTQFNQQLVKNVVHDLLHKKRQTQVQLQRDIIIDDNQSIKSISQAEDEQLSSGDQDKELTNNEFEQIKKDIVRFGVLNREATRRQILSMAEKKVELANYYVQDFTQRLHHKNSAAIQRIYKFKSRQKVREDQMIPYSFSNREKQRNFQLPYIKK